MLLGHGALQVRLLVHAEADAEKPAHDGSTPFAAACLEGQVRADARKTQTNSPFFFQLLDEIRHTLPARFLVCAIDLGMQSTVHAKTRTEARNRPCSAMLGFWDKYTMVRAGTMTFHRDFGDYQDII